MENNGWKIRFCWVKVHAGTRGNELADKIAKEASANKDIPICYNRVPKSVIKNGLEATIVDKWQKEWDKTTMGKNYKDYFPEVAGRLNTKKYYPNPYDNGHGSW